MTTLRFEFPLPPRVLNAGNKAHWSVTHGQKQRYYATCDLMQKLGMLPKPPARPFKQAALTSLMRLGAWMDDDNAMARHKFVLDWLKTRGYVTDDRKKNIRWTALPEQKVGRKQKYNIELTLTEEAA